MDKGDWANYISEPGTVPVGTLRINFEIFEWEEVKEPFTYWVDKEYVSVLTYNVLYKDVTQERVEEILKIIL